MSVGETLRNRRPNNEADPSGEPTLQRALTRAALAIGAVYALLVLLWGEAVFALTFDDAFYYFTIARNVAEGTGSTFDGLNPTNGYHPLWLVMSVPVYLVGLDGMQAARALLVLQVGSYTAALVVLARAVTTMAGPWRTLRADTTGPGNGEKRSGPPRTVRMRNAIATFAFVVVAANPFVVKIFVNGLESGISVLLYALVVLRLCEVRGSIVTHRDQRWRVLTALVLLLLVLTRTDAVLLVGTLGLWCLAEVARATRSQPAEQRPSLVASLRPLVELFTPAVIGLGAYMVFNRMRFGTTMQISGLIKRADLTVGTAVAILVVVALAGFIGWRSWLRVHPDDGTEVRRHHTLPRTIDALSRLGWLTSFSVLIVGYYTLLSLQQWLWYFAPLGVLVLVLVPLVASDFAETALTQAHKGQSPVRAVAPAVAILLVPLVLAFVFQTNAFVDPNVRSIQIANREAGEWIDANLDDDVVLASWDAGVVGYFARRSVVNLDGVVNSFAFYQAMRDGEVAAFLDADDVSLIVNHGLVIDGHDPEITGYVERLWGPQAQERTVLVRSWPFTFSGTTTGMSGTVRHDNSPFAVFLYELPPPGDRQSR